MLLWLLSGMIGSHNLSMKQQHKKTYDHDPHNMKTRLTSLCAVGTGQWKKPMN